MLCVSLLGLVRSFTKTSPLRNSCKLLACQNSSRLGIGYHLNLCLMSSLFSPPDCRQLSRAATYSLLRVHPPPHTTFRHCLIDSCGVVTSFSRFAYGRANAAWMMPGFPSYCAGSLSVDYVSNHLLQLFLYRASRLFARSLPQPAESSLLTLRSL